MYFTFVETYKYALEEISTIFGGDKEFSAVAAAAGKGTEKHRAITGDMVYAKNGL
jgi:hypothetical protein